MPINRLGELAIGKRAGLCHLFQAQVHPHGHERSHEFQLLFPDQSISRCQMRKMTEESRPVIDFQKQIGQGEMRQQGVDPLFQTLNIFWDRFFEGREMEMSFFVEYQGSGRDCFLGPPFGTVQPEILFSW